jgi:hypothetical protein
MTNPGQARERTPEPEFRELLEGTREQVRELGSFETLFWLVCEKRPRELEAKPMGPYASAELTVAWSSTAEWHLPFPLP